MSKSEKGGIWKFTLQVDLPVSVHSSSSSSSDQVDEAFRTLFLPGIPDSLSSVEIFISRDAANQFAATASGSILFNIQGFVQATNQVRAVMLHAWLGHATWTRVKTRWHKTPRTKLSWATTIRSEFKYMGRRRTRRPAVLGR